MIEIILSETENTMHTSLMPALFGLFKVDTLSWVMIALVGFVSINVHLFSRKYLKGDGAITIFFIRLWLLVSSVFIMVTADHLAVFFVSWAAGNFLLTRLMIHKDSWKAAKESGRIALLNFSLGLIFLAFAFIGCYQFTGTTSIQEILQKNFLGNQLLLIQSLLVLAAMTQSAIWPFHKWLISSLNSPTPVSALMHAGLINGGGFLLVRFAPIFGKAPGILQLLFLIGLATALLGTLWKLMQHDIKRMLACSTMGQMGFMIAQCGLGLFPAAIAHLCWHGLFKAYLFLSSGSAAQEKRIDPDYSPNIKVFLMALICGIGGAIGFAMTSHKDLAKIDSTLFLTGIAFLSGAQLAIAILKNDSLKKWPLAFIATGLAGVIYGYSVYSIEILLEPLHIMLPQPLGVLHMLGFLLLTCSWLLLLFGKRNFKAASEADWVKYSYVKMLNASQPHPRTITAHHNHYQY